MKRVTPRPGLSPRLCGGSFELHQIYDSPATRGPLSEFSLPQPPPQYVAAHSGNVTAVLGKGAILNCRVRAIGNRTVGIQGRDKGL